MFESLLRLLGFGLCHQIPQRSFFGGGYQVPVCARDTGLYVGLTVASLLLLAMGGKRRPSEAPPWWIGLLCAAFLGVMLWDGVTSYAGLRPTTNDVRLLTGLLAGFAIAAFAVPLAVGTLAARPGRERVMARPAEVVAWLAAIPVTFAVVRWLMPLLGPAYPAIVAVCILFSFTGINMVIVGVFRPFERSVERLRDLLAPGAIAAVLTLVEVLGSAAVRVALLGWR